MTITIDNPVTTERQIAYVDTMGNQFCASCFHAGSRYPCVEASVDGPECSQCGSDMESSIEIVEGTATVERFTCKIF